MPKYNIQLKVAMIAAGMTQRDVCKKTGIAESILSMIVRGRYVPDNDQASSIATVLNKTIDELFE